MNFHLLEKLLRQKDGAGEAAAFIQNLPSLLGELSVVPPRKNLGDNCFASSAEIQRGLLVLPVVFVCAMCSPPQTLSCLHPLYLPCLVTSGNEVYRDQTWSGLDYERHHDLQQAARD